MELEYESVEAAAFIARLDALPNRFCHGLGVCLKKETSCESWKIPSREWPSRDPLATAS
jgi:hypothetical protein